jgi:hypothetical protein
MRQSRSWKDRLPGALFALAPQAGLFALLAASSTPQHKTAASPETVLFLPPRLQRPVPVIDARQPPRSAPAQSVAPALSTPPAASALLPAPEAQTPNAPALLAALGRALACEPDKDGRPSPLISCRGIRMRPRNDRTALAPSLPVYREAEWAAERARANKPVRVPCVSMQSRNMRFGNMSVGPEDHEFMVDPLCVIGELAR